MIPFFRHLIDKFLHDELAVRRWGRAVLMALSVGGLAFADQLADVMGYAGDDGLVRAVKIAAVVAGFLSLAVTAGERNVPPPPPGPEK